MANERWTISGLLMDDWDCANCHRHFDGGGVVVDSGEIDDEDDENSDEDDDEDLDLDEPENF